MKQSNKGKNIIIYLVILAALFFALSAFLGGKRDTVSYSAVAAFFREERVVRFTVDGSDVLTMELTDGTVYRHELADVDAFRQELGPLFEDQAVRGILKSYDFKQGYTMPTWLIVLLACMASVVLALVIWLVLSARQQSAQERRQPEKQDGEEQQVDDDIFPFA